MLSNSSLMPAPQMTQNQGAAGENKQKTRKHVSSACRTCKTRKLKCSGIVPCENCVKTKHDCVIDAEGDQRRKLNLKRKMDILENDRQVLVHLIETLRTGQDDRVTELVNYIRSSTSVDNIKLFLENHFQPTKIERMPLSNDLYADLESWQNPQITHPKTLEIRRKVDIPVASVPAKPWTTVTDDDAFVSHLVSLWLTWHLPWFHCLHQEIFITAMQSANLQSALCSPFLVNAILASACFFSDYPEACAISGDTRTTGEHFYIEAKRLLDDEEGHFSIPTVQGLIIMLECSFSMGKDRAGWIYAIQAAEGIRTLRKRQARLVLEADLSTTDLGQFIDRIELGLFNVFVSSALALQIEPQIKKPRGLFLSTPCGTHIEEFIPYPLSEKPLPAHNDCVLDTLTRMGDVVWDITSFLFREERDYTRADLVDAVQGWHTRLSKCWETRPSCIDCEKNPLPGVLTLYMYYNNIIITMYAFLKTLPPDADNHALEWAERARQICLSSAHTISRLTETQQSYWGPDLGPAANAYFVTISLYILMEDLKNPESHAAFMNLCRNHIHFAKRFPLHRGTIRMVQLTAQRMNDPLPHDVVAHFREFEERYWKPDSGRRFSSRYPNFAIAIRQSSAHLPDDLELDAFLEKWVSLDETRADSNHSWNEDGYVS